MSQVSSRLSRWRLVTALIVSAIVLAIAAPAAVAAPGFGSGLPLVAPPSASLLGLGGKLESLASGPANPIDALSSAASVAEEFGLTALGSWVLGGARGALQETARVIDRTTAPRLESTWFSATYWRVAGLAALLTLPFLFAAAVQALLRSDLGLLVRSAFGYLPLALIGVSLAAPLTMLLLSVTDEMCSVVAGAGSGGGVHFLQQTAVEITGLASLEGSGFLALAIGLLTVGAALALATEMLVREAAVYIVVLMLPLAFAGLVWPARRIWAVRTVELLISLILSKFVIVAVLSLAGAAYGSTGSPSMTRLLMAMALVMLSTFAPWVMLRLLPFTELAAGAGGALRGEVSRWSRAPGEALEAAEGLSSRVEKLAHKLRPQGNESEQSLLPRRDTGQGRAHGENGAGPSGGDGAGPLGRDGTGPSDGDGAGAGPLGADTAGARAAAAAEPQSSVEPAGSPSPGDSSRPPGGDPVSSPAPTEPGSGVRPAERLPGLSSRWQAEDMEAPPFVLGRREPAGQGEELPLPPTQERDEGLL